MNPSEDNICREIVRYVREVASPRKIVLFGSRARGDGDKDSDYDLLVVKDEIKSRHEEAHKIRIALMALQSSRMYLCAALKKIENTSNFKSDFRNR